MDTDTDTTDKNRLISLPEAANLYGFSHSYLRTIAKKGRLKAQKVGTSWVTTPSDVENFISSRQERGVYRGDIFVS